MFNKEQNVEVSDTTKFNNITKAGNKKLYFISFIMILSILCKLYIERMFQRLPLLLLCFVSLKVFSQDAEIFKPDSIKKEINAVQITTSLHIDGVLNEPEWNLSKPSPRFTQIEPHQNAELNFETYVKVLYNKDYLYFGIFSKDSLGKNAIRATDFKR